MLFEDRNVQAYFAISSAENRKYYRGQNTIRGGVNVRLGEGGKYTKYNKINNNSENFRMVRL